MFKSYLTKLPVRNINLNVYIAGIFITIVSVVFCVSSSAHQEIANKTMTITPISGLQQMETDLNITGYYLTSKTAIVKSTGLGSYLLTLNSPLCSPSNSAILSTFPALSSNKLEQQTEKSWTFDLRDPSRDSYLVIQTIGTLCADQNDKSKFLMKMDLTISNK